VSSFKGVLVIAQTALAAATAATATAIASVQSGTSFANMNGFKMSTNDVVALSPRAALGSASSNPISYHGRVSAISTAGAATIEVTLGNGTAAGVTAVAQTYDVNVSLRTGQS
jgi:hypothetical protein